MASSLPARSLKALALRVSSALNADGAISVCLIPARCYLDSLGPEADPGAAVATDAQIKGTSLPLHVSPILSPLTDPLTPTILPSSSVHPSTRRDRIPHRRLLRHDAQVDERRHLAPNSSSMARRTSASSTCPSCPSKSPPTLNRLSTDYLRKRRISSSASSLSKTVIPIRYTPCPFPYTTLTLVRYPFHISPSFPRIPQLDTAPAPAGC